MTKIDDTLRETIQHLALAPEGQLAEPLAQECRIFEYTDAETARRFLRNLRDKAVYTGGASPFVMQILTGVCDNPPEPKAEEDLETWTDDADKTGNAERLRELASWEGDLPGMPHGTVAMSALIFRAQAIESHLAGNTDAALHLEHLSEKKIREYRQLSSLES